MIYIFAWHIVILLSVLKILGYEINQSVDEINDTLGNYVDT